MPINSISTDYTGRTKDIHIMQGVDPNKAALITPSFGKISNYCTGIQKLIQRYTIMLLNELGSQENYPEFGTNFLTRLNTSSLVFNRLDVFPIFNFASDKVVTELRIYQRTSLVPEDEQIDTATLTQITGSGNNIGLQILIEPVAQPSVTFILPIPSA